MRLIDTSTLDFREFVDDIPKYAILSHTWEATGEIKYEQWIAREEVPITHLSGYQKIVGACEKARSHNIDWLWVDTNCIDKRSSAELTEAINSMFDWYHEALECYAFMADVQIPENGKAATHPNFSRSRWFTRGWTLQELLAPKDVIFYDSNWVRLGSRNGSLLKTISKATKIHEDALRSVAAMSLMSISAKMSWLSHRRTTRVEDMAYCMLGIFDLNMPLVYGEGRKAFTRLQEEIIKKSNDQTIFCWAWTDDVPLSWTSILAPSPSTFKWAVDFEPSDTGNETPYQVTNRGLSIDLPFGSLVWGTACCWVSLSVVSDHCPFGRACIPITWSSKSGPRRRTYRRQAWPPRPMMLSAWPLMKVADLWIETLPSRFPRHLMQSGDTGMPSTPHSTDQFRFGLILLLPHARKLGRTGSVMTAMDYTVFTLPASPRVFPGLFILGPSSGPGPVSWYILISVSFGREVIYAGVKRTAQRQSRVSSTCVWYIKSWKPPNMGSDYMEKALVEATTYVRRVQRERLRPEESRRKYGVYINIGEVVDLGVSGESRVICLGEDFQPLLVSDDRLNRANAGDALSDTGSLVVRYHKRLG